MKIKILTKDIAVMGIMLAIIEAAKFALSFIAGVEIVTLLFILYTLFFDKKMVYVLPVFLIIEGIIGGFGIWWFMYVYTWAILIIVSYLFRKRTSMWFWSIISGLFGLLFGTLCCPVYFITFGTETAISWWIAGIPTDIIHGVSNFILCMILFKPLKKVMDNIKRKYIYN